MQMTIPFGTKRSRRWIPLLSVGIPALGWLIFGLYPAIATIFYSLTQYSGIPGTPLYFSGLHNYVEIFTSSFSELKSTIWTTIEYTVGVTILQNVVGLALAFLMNRRRRGFAFYRALIFLPQVFSVIVVAALFLLLFDPIDGPMEHILHAITGGNSAFFGTDGLAIWLVVIANVWMFSGYTMMIYIAGLRNVPATVYEASSLDGAGRFARFWYITWPLLAPATTVNVWLTAIGSLGQYALILALTSGNHGTQTIGMYMFGAAFGSTNGASSQLGFGSMLAVLQFAMTLIIGGVLLWFLRRREVQL
jgi:raffinose/stachyose/melibiose transport system permease protein